MKKITSIMFAVVLAGIWCLGNSVGYASDILKRIDETGEVRMGFRQGSIPFGYKNEKGEWVGFSIDIGEHIRKALEKKFRKPIKMVKIAIKPDNRIQMITDGTIDIGIGSTTITLEREKTVDFSLPYFLTGARLLVSVTSPIRNFIPDLSDKRVGLTKGATANISGFDWLNNSGRLNPKSQKVLFEEHDQGFEALQRGEIDAFCTDECILAGLKAQSKNPKAWRITAQYLTYEPYGMILPQNQSQWRNFVNACLVRMVKSRDFEKLYEKWFGPYGVVPLPMSEKYQNLLKVISFPD